MKDAFALVDYASFETAMRQTKLPGTENQDLLKEIHQLATRCIHLQTEAQQKINEMIAHSRSVQSHVSSAHKSLIAARDICEKQWPIKDHPLWHWRMLFHPADEALSDLSRAMKKVEKSTLTRMAPHFLEKKEGLKWQPLFLLLDHTAYPLDRLGLKVVETWFLGEIDMLLSQYVNDKRVKLRSRYKFIETIFLAAFRYTIEITTIKQQIIRIRKIPSTLSRSSNIFLTD